MPRPPRFPASGVRPRRSPALSSAPQRVMEFALGCVLVNGLPVAGGTGRCRFGLTPAARHWSASLDQLSDFAIGRVVDAWSRGGRIEVVTSDGGSGRATLRRPHTRRSSQLEFLSSDPWREDPTVVLRRVAVAAAPPEAGVDAVLDQAIRTRRIGALWTSDGMCWEIERMLARSDETLTVLLAVDGQQRVFPRHLAVWWVPAV